MSYYACTRTSEYLYKVLGPIHGTSTNCTNDRVTPPFKEDYIQPTQLIQKFFLFTTNTINSKIFLVEYYKDPCHIRLYYEHGFINCPSIIFTVQELQNICIKCWGPIHGTSGNCTNDRVTPLFKEGYIQPTQLIQNFFFRS
ncbi:unnamed protein product [Rhizophagus irregularis]|nr:unnamed protein product [Rhizophagus irregularis]